MSDPFDLNRFLQAQLNVYEGVLIELGAGAKTGHWMWYVFPQIIGLGKSPTTRRYAIKSAAEAVAYLEHTVLGVRLLQCTRLVYGLSGRSVEKIFGFPDNLKFCSSMTLFAEVSSEEIFNRVLEKYFEAKPDMATTDILKGLEQ